MRYLIGLFAFALGAVMVLKTEPIFSWTGAIAFAEKYLGVGESRLFIKLLGVVIIIVGMLVITGAIENIILSLFAPALRTPR